jgi:hypothetical protein
VCTFNVGRAAPSGVDLRAEESRFEADVGDRELEDLTLIGPPYIADAYPLTESVYAVSLEVSGEATYEVEVGTSGFWHQPHRVPDDVRLSRDERTAYFKGFAGVRVLFDGRYDATTGTLGELSLLGLAEG